MSWIAKDIPTLIFMLLPGFVTAGLFYALTAHPKTSEFERVVQALIYTSVLRIFTYGIHSGLLFVGNHVWTLGRWTNETELAWSLFLAVLLGLILAYLANHDMLHTLMRKRGITKRTSYPCEWYASFVRDQRWVILNLVDGRRIYGWPEEWPDQPDKGHFALNQPEWLLDTGESAPLYQAERLIIPAVDVKMIEFLKEAAEITQDSSELDRARQLLLDSQEHNDGSQGTAASAEPFTTG